MDLYDEHIYNHVHTVVNMDVKMHIFGLSNHLQFGNCHFYMLEIRTVIDCIDHLKRIHTAGTALLKVKA